MKATILIFAGMLATSQAQAYECNEVGPEFSYTHMNEDIATRNAEVICEPHAGSGQICYSKGCVQVPNGNYICTYSVYECH